MALVDRALRWKELGEDNLAHPRRTRNSVLYQSDNIQATGFLEHIKLPHYVDFQSELGADPQHAVTRRQGRRRGDKPRGRPLGGSLKRQMRRGGGHERLITSPIWTSMTKRMIRRAILQGWRSRLTKCLCQSARCRCLWLGQAAGVQVSAAFLLTPEDRSR